MFRVWCRSCRGIRVTNDKDSTNVNISISAAVTSYARIIMGKTKLDLISPHSGGQGINLYYSDTDSLVVNKPLSNEYIGSSLGQYKLEHTIKRGCSSKTYLLVLPDNTVIVKAKGVINTSLNEQDFITLLNENSVKATQSKIDYEVGTVNISSKERILN
jgi:hypothetical protein